MSGKRHKRELKRQRELIKQQHREAERRRTLITVGVIAVVVLVGFGLIWSTVTAERRAEAAAACGATKPEAADADRPTGFTEAPQMALRSGDYTAVFETSCGTVTVDLYEQKAPATVNNFVALAMLRFYDGLQVFRNAPSIFALQTGSATNQADFQIGYTFADELTGAQEEGYKAGSLAMANSGPNTNGSQFFFTYGDSSLPPQYSKFGQVTEGLDVLKKMGEIPVDGEAPRERIFIESVQILVDGKPLVDILEAEREREKAEQDAGDDDDEPAAEGDSAADDSAEADAEAGDAADAASSAETGKDD